MDTTTAYQVFLTDVDRELQDKFGKFLKDFPEYNFLNDYETGMTVAFSAAEAVLEQTNI